MYDDLQGKVAIVAGGAGAIGAAQVRLLRADGAKVVAADLNDKVGEELVATLGPDIRYVHADVSSEDDWARVAETAMAEFGRIDLLSNSFGISPQCPLEEMSLETYMVTISVNQIGVFLGMKAVCHQMIAQGSGAIVNISSNSAIQSSPFLGAYAASKAAVNAMTLSAAAEWGRYGIRANVINPGGIRSALNTATAEAWQASRGVPASASYTNIPLPRLGEPEELGAMALFLLSDASSYCTGSTFTVDGGKLGGRAP